MSQEIELVTWYFELNAPPGRDPVSLPEDLDMVRAIDPPVHFYRYLYDTIGSPWVWWERKRQTDEEVLAEIHHPAVEVWVPYYRGVPVGLSEIDFRKPGDTELKYFGLMPEYCGRGWGRLLIDWTIDHAYTKSDAKRFWLHTCSLDSPAAIRTYTAAGMRQYDEIREWIGDPAATLQ